MPRIICLVLFGAIGAAFVLACSSSDDDDRGGVDADSDADSDTDTGADGGGDADSDADTDADTDTGAVGCERMDILFVIDDSASMGCEQTMLGMAFPEFINVIEEYNNANADKVAYRIGVTSTGKSIKYTLQVPLVGKIPMSEKGLDGKLVKPAGAASPWIDGPGDTAAITSQFTDAASLGTGGPTYEMPLQSLRLALQKDAPGGVNEGFLREDSLFITVVITDEDDCSRTDNNFTITSDSCMSAPKQHNLVDLEEFWNEFNTRFNGPEGWVFVAIAGLAGCDADSYPTSCDADTDYAYAGAMDAVRLQDFVNNYVNSGSYHNGLFSDICTKPLQGALAEALEKMKVACDEYVPPVVK